MIAHVSDDFVKTLFDIIEVNSADVNDPYHYPIIRVLLVLNEREYPNLEKSVLS